ncbi:MAG: DUF3135 domain-containing protein [Gammaproteobacteria bacterium]
MSEQITNFDFDFDEWMQLAKEDPEAFEQKRQEAIQDVISGAQNHTKNRLEGLQWQLDQIRNTSASPMATCLNISKMMWENVQGEDGLVETLNQLTGEAPIKQKPMNRAEVLELKPKSSDSSEKTG